MKTQVQKNITTLLVVLSAVSLIVSGCCKKCPEIINQNDTIIEEFNFDIKELTFAQPVTDDECELMFKHRDSVYTLNPPTSSLNFISTKVRLLDFVDYYRLGTTQNINAIRFYPGFISPDKVFLVLTKGYWDTTEKFKIDADIVLLKSSNYTLSGVKFPSVENSASARTHVSDYFKYVYLHNRMQDTSMIDYKKTRTFAYSEIRAFLNANIAGYDSLLANDRSKLANFKLLFEIGYTDQMLSQRFYQRASSADPEFGRLYSDRSMMGYTVTISLIDNLGNLLRNNEVGINRYYRKALEIAHICPPVCGDLY